MLFDSDLSRLNADDVLSAFDGDKRLVRITPDEVSQHLSRLAVQSKLVRSRGEANRAMASGGFYLNGKKVTDPQAGLTPDDLISGRFCVIGVGKSEKKILFLT